MGVLTIAGGALRFFNLGNKSLWYDEAVVYHLVQGSWREILTQNALENSAPPLYALLLGLLTGPDASEATLRTLSALAGTAAIPVCYLLAREFLPARTAWVAPLLLALAPTQVIYSQQLREYSLTTLTAGLLLLAFARFIREPGNRQALWLAAAAVLGLLTQYGLGLLLAGLNLVCLGAFVLARRPPSAYGRWLLVQLPAAAVAAVLYLLVVRYQLGLVTEAGSGYLAPHYLPGPARPLLAFLTARENDIIGFAFPGVLLLFLWAFGLFAFLLGASSGLATAMFLVPTGLVIVCAMFGIYPYGAIRQDIFLTPMVYVCAALGADRLAALLPRRVPELARLVALGALAAAAVLPGLDESQRFVRQTPGYQPMRYVTAALVDQLFGATDRKIYVYYNAIPAFRYYWRHRPEPWISGTLHRSYMDDAKARGQMEDVQAELAALSAEGKPYWLVLSHISVPDENWLMEFLERTNQVQMIEGGTRSALLLITPLAGRY